MSRPRRAERRKPPGSSRNPAAYAARLATVNDLGRLEDLYRITPPRSQPQRRGERFFLSAVYAAVDGERSPSAPSLQPEGKPAMKRFQPLLVLLALPAFTLPAQAQFFHKRPRPIPAQRVPELILILKTETDERRRGAAAEELRDYDARTFTEIVPVLIDVLHTDRKVGVRIEALATAWRGCGRSAGPPVRRSSRRHRATNRCGYGCKRSRRC